MLMYTTLFDQKSVFKSTNIKTEALSNYFSKSKVCLAGMDFHTNERKEGDMLVKEAKIFFDIQMTCGGSPLMKILNFSLSGDNYRPIFFHTPTGPIWQKKKIV